jgi:hypothetical protein
MSNACAISLSDPPARCSLRIAVWYSAFARTPCRSASTTAIAASRALFKSSSSSIARHYCLAHVDSQGAAGTRRTAVPYARTSVVPLMNSVAS